MPSSNPKKRVTKAYGFGVVPSESKVHYLVSVSKGSDANVSIFERGDWDEGAQKVNHKFDTAKAELSIAKWDKIKPVLAKEFNDRLRAKRYSLGKWAATKTPVHRLLGKEMLVLAWAVADSDPSSIETAIKNWVGLRPEERWWLFTMTNASTGGVDDKTGWRKALRYALTENPVLDNSSSGQRSIFSQMLEEDL